MLAGGLALASPGANAQESGDAQQEEPLPIVFVHGGAGSGAQYESQAMRFASNGYPAERVRAFEYGEESSDRLDGFIDDILEEFDVDQVHTAGHSLGTLVMSNYLSIPDQAAKVASYASLDGLPATCTGENAPECVNISAADLGQTHVEAATSPESFAIQYELFMGEPPATTDILPSEWWEIELAGRAVNFPANTGIDGATLQVWPVDSQGRRTLCAHPPPPGAHWDIDCEPGPEATFELDASGDWGPVRVRAGQRYELALTRDGHTIHYYTQPYYRSSYLVRLNAAPPDSGTAENTNRSPNHTAAVVVRYQEWWTDHGSGNNDILAIYTRDGDGQVVEEPVPVLENVTGNGNIGIHIHDDAATPETSSLELLPFFPDQVFQTGVDVFMPADPDGAGTVSFVHASRGMYEMRDWQIVNTPNWPSDEHTVIVQFNDYIQDAAPGPARPGAARLGRHHRARRHLRLSSLPALRDGGSR